MSDLIILKKEKKDFVELHCNCNGCYKDIKIDYEDFSPEDTGKNIDFFHIFLLDEYGYKDFVKVLYVDNEEAVFRIVRKEYSRGDY